MKRCSCGLPFPPTDEIQPIGVMKVDQITPLILFNCVCGSTQSVWWTRASALLVARAMRKERARAAC